MFLVSGKRKREGEREGGEEKREERKKKAHYISKQKFVYESNYETINNVLKLHYFNVYLMSIG